MHEGKPLGEDEGSLMRYLMIVSIIVQVLVLWPNWANASVENGISNVIFVTLDGVRWQEVFKGLDLGLTADTYDTQVFKNLNGILAKDGILIGDRISGSEMTVSNSYNISLPAYQSLMAGYAQKCATNICGRIKVETVMERVRRELNLSKKEVAVFATWESIPLAVEHEKGNIKVGKTGGPDRETFAAAMKYLENNSPRFMYISLGDADHYAHTSNYTKYIETLKDYDRWLLELVHLVDSLPDYQGSTAIIVTTDHGRGNGIHWTGHGIQLPESKYVWLYARSPSTLGMGRLVKNRTYHHNDLRPTIESLFGLAPRNCYGCGDVIQEIYGLSFDECSN
jgi:hypothetical protein